MYLDTYTSQQHSISINMWFTTRRLPGFLTKINGIAVPISRNIRNMSTLTKTASDIEVSLRKFDVTVGIRLLNHCNCLKEITYTCDLKKCRNKKSR